METNNSQLVIYKAPDGTMSIDVTVQNETVWLSQGQMAELFGKDQSVIARHISNVFKEGELKKESNMQILHNTLSKFKPTQVYSLDVIISVGYRVKSKRGTQFRIWANQVLKQYLLQGYAINERVAAQKYDELSQLVKVLGRTIQNQEKMTEDIGAISACSSAITTTCAEISPTCACQNLNAEIIILLKLMLHDIVATIYLRDCVAAHWSDCRQLQRVNNANGVVALVFLRFKPLFYLFCKFVFHKNISLQLLRHELVFQKI